MGKGKVGPGVNPGIGTLPVGILKEEGCRSSASFHSRRENYLKGKQQVKPGSPDTAAVAQMNAMHKTLTASS